MKKQNKHKRVEIIKVRHCEDCEHFTIRYDALVCDENQRLMFYKPKSHTDKDWGYKRKCERFSPADDLDSITNRMEVGNFYPRRK